MYTFQTHMAAFGVDKEIENRLAQKKIGPLDDRQHPLNQMVAELFSSAVVLIPPEGRNLWRELVQMTAGEAPLIISSQPIGNGVDEISWQAASGDTSSKEALDCARRFQEWVFRTFLPESPFKCYIVEMVAWLDGAFFEFKEAEDGFRILAYLSERPNDKVTAEVISKEVFEGKRSKKHVSRKIDDLGKPFCDFIKSDKRGYWFDSAALAEYLNMPRNAR